MAARYNVLALDGGGIRGLLTSTLLERLEAADTGFLDHVDLIAGTSAGGILALGLAAGFSPADISALYRERGPSIFPPDVWDHLGDVDKLAHSDYRSEPLKDALEDKFGDLTLGELDKKVVVSTFDLDSGGLTKAGLRSWKPKFFQNFEGDPGDLHQRVVDVAMRTSAAPTFFPVYQGFIDGGVVANNPSMCGLAQALDERTAGQNLDDIALLSVGAGLNPRYVTAVDEGWGLLQWAPHLVGIMLDGMGGVADFQCRQILGPRYCRVDAVLPEDVALDGVGKIGVIEDAAARADISAARSWIAGSFVADEDD